MLQILLQREEVGDELPEVGDFRANIDLQDVFDKGVRAG